MKKIVIAAMALLVVVGGLALWGSTWRFSLTVGNDGALVANQDGYNISFSGSDKYTDDELIGFLFKDEMSSNPIVFWWKNLWGETVEIPFIETYDIESTGFFDFEVTFYDKSIVGYMTYMGYNQYFDKDGVVVESSLEVLDGVPLVAGIDVDHIILHEKLPVRDEKIFSLLLDVTQLIEKYQIDAGKIDVSDQLDIRLHIGDVRVELGKGDMLNEKFIDLNDIVPKLKGVKGVLDMKEYDYEGNGYTLKKDS